MDEKDLKLVLPEMHLLAVPVRHLGREDARMKPGSHQVGTDYTHHKRIMAWQWVLAKCPVPKKKKIEK